jgi:NAD(P)-dependent dehydrogenase (short-subunit alcohol dehydrogenase family)
MLAAERVRVAIAARRLQRLNDLAERIHQAGGDALPIQADVTDEAQATAMVEHVLREAGRLDLLLNVAGSALPPRSKRPPPRNTARWLTPIFSVSSTRSSCIAGDEAKATSISSSSRRRRPLHPSFNSVLGTRMQRAP